MNQSSTSKSQFLEMSFKSDFFYIFWGSFGVICCQTLLAKILESMIHNEILSFLLAFAPYYLGMTLAVSKRWPWSAATLSIVQGLFQAAFLLFTLWLPSILNLWLGLSNLAPPSLPPQSPALFLIWITLGSLTISFLHGFELPLVIKKSSNPMGLLLWPSYMAGLFAFLFTPLVLIPIFGLKSAPTFVLILYGLQYIAALRYSKRTGHLKKDWKKRIFRYLSHLCIVWVGPLLITTSIASFDSFRIKASYLDGLEYWPETPFQTLLDGLRYVNQKIELQEAQTPFQKIDWVTYHKENKKSHRLYLNGEFQLDTDTENQYHSSYFSGLSDDYKFNLKSVLIIGAGDGFLPTKVKQEIPNINLIKIVEIDAAMIEFSKNNLNEFHQGIWSSPQVDLTLDDAFHYVQNCKPEFDLILIDLPFPTSYGLSRVYSEEFYKMAKSCLKETRGALVLDAPTESPFGEIVSTTLKSAGFDYVVAYGSGNTYFLAADQNRDWLNSLKMNNEKILHFDVENSKINSNLSNQLWNPKLPHIN